MDIIPFPVLIRKVSPIPEKESRSAKFVESLER